MDYLSECCDAVPLGELGFTYLEDTSIEIDFIVPVATISLGVVALGQCSKCREHSLFEKEGA
jgi:hypothetical protein